MTTVAPLALGGVFEITPRKFGDDRGFFSETWTPGALAGAGIDLDFVQDNHAYSLAAGTFRGLHYQLPPRAQAKLVRVTRGSILDVAVDIRRSSPTFGRWLSLVVSAAKWNQILVPAGFAHGYLTLEPDTEVIYKVSDGYSPEHERGIRFDDPAIGIDWPLDPATFQLSGKDRVAPLLADADVFD
ncbi:MAG TPA: dTDP-4-dehydrorhamnose 3,5-epimerase [Devosia sp.]|nr:dTDP-4-dehydrorhamnose 3,5-epimerase [Devosia sp.]